MADKKNKFDKLTETIYPIVYRNLQERGHNPELADVITMQLAYESNYGTEPTGRFNLGGIKHSGERMKNYEFVVGPKDTEHYTSFKSYDDSIKFYLHNTEQKWGDALTAMSSDEYIDKIHQADNGGYSYSGTDTERYKATMNGMKTMKNSIEKFKSVFDPKKYKDYIGEKELARTGASAKITDDSIQRLDSYVERGKPKDKANPIKEASGKSYDPSLQTEVTGIPNSVAVNNEVEGGAEMTSEQGNAVPSVANPGFNVPVEEAIAEQVNVDELNFNYQPKETASSLLSFSKGNITLPETKPSEAMAEQDSKLSKEREQRFNFTGVPTLSASTGLVGDKFEEGGALTEFNTGGEHNENPLGGIRQGINEAGTYNLVEEGETKYNDYIFSDKFFLSASDLLRARLDPKLEGKSVAEASKYLNRYLDEAPFDKITRDTVNEQLDNLILLNEKFKEDTEFINRAFKVSDNPEELMVEEDTYQEPLPVDVENQDYQFNLGGGLSYSSALDDAIANGKFNPANPNGGLNNGLNSGLNQASGIASGAMGLYGTVSDSLSTSGISTDGDSFTDPNSINQGKMGVQGALSGASAGAAIGSVVPVIGTAIGAVGGALIGGVSGLIGGNKKKKKAEESVRNYEYKQMNTELENEGMIFAGGGRLKGSRYRLEGSMLDEYNTLLEGIEKSGDEVDKDKIAKIILTRNGKNPSDYIDSHSSVYPKVTAAMHLNHKMGNYNNPNGDLGQLPYVNRPFTEDIEEPGGGGDIGGNPVAQQAVSYMPTVSSVEEVYHPSSFTPNASTAMTGAEGTRSYELVNSTPTEAETNFQQPQPEVPEFIPRTSGLANAMTYAPAVGSLLNVLDKQTPEQVSFQTNDFVYTPDYVDENTALNPVRQASANTLRSLEQSGMSAGQMASAKLAAGANEARGVSEAYNQINAINRAEDRTVKDYEYRTTAENVGIYNQEIEANEANRAMADLQNRQSRNELFQNLGEIGKDTRNVNTAFNMSRGYTQSGIFNPNDESFLDKIAKRVNDLKKEKGGSLFQENDRTLLLKALLNQR